MINPFKTILQNTGTPFQIERENKIISTIDGSSIHESSTNRQYIGFLPNSDVKAGDWAINQFGERFYIEDTRISTFQKQPHKLTAYYLTQVEYQKLQKTTNTVFNIQNAYGSVIGTQGHVILNYNEALSITKKQIETTDSPDKEELQKIITLLEMVINNQVPATKGLFSKFSEVMERNSWITSSITSTLLGWLLTQIQ